MISGYPINSLFSEVDTFINNVLERTDCLNILSNTPQSYESLFEVSVCHDIFIRMYDMINSYMIDKE